jgi:hypothetical protein
MMLLLRLVLLLFLQNWFDYSNSPRSGARLSRLRWPPTALRG